MRKFLVPCLVFMLTSCDLVTHQKAGEVVEVYAPETKPNFETNDSSYLKLKIMGEKFEANFLKNITKLDNISSLDTFLQKNAALIDREKIVLTNLDTTAENKALRNLLTKHGFSKLKLNY